MKFMIQSSRKTFNAQTISYNILYREMFTENDVKNMLFIFDIFNIFSKMFKVHFSILNDLLIKKEI